jgi:bifunctional non-homologous end joining protein LigD
MRSAQTAVLARLDAIAESGGDGTLALTRGVALHVSSLDKVYFPKAGVTKGDLFRYYTTVSPQILPVLKDRALSLKRFPNGVRGKFFFQQKAPPDPPAGVRVETVISEAGEEQERLIGGSLATLLYCVQIAAFDFNPWNARVGSLEHPDFTVIDLDPGPKAPFSRVVELALLVKERMDALGLHGIAKTSGATGIHIVLPLPRGATEATAERVAQHIATGMAQDKSSIATVERSLKARKPGQIYVDAGQNSRGKTVAAAYSVRAKEGATVSTPLDWSELTPSLTPDAFTTSTVPSRIAEVGDLWAQAMRKPNPLRLVTSL